MHFKLEQLFLVVLDSFYKLHAFFPLAWEHIHSHTINQASHNDATSSTTFTTIYMHTQHNH